MTVLDLDPSTPKYDAKKAINEIEWMTDYLASQIEVEGISNSARMSYAREINKKKDELIAYIKKLEEERFLHVE